MPNDQPLRGPQLSLYRTCDCHESEAFKPRFYSAPYRRLSRGSHVSSIPQTAVTYVSISLCSDGVLNSRLVSLECLTFRSFISGVPYFDTILHLLAVECVRAICLICSQIHGAAIISQSKRASRPVILQMWHESRPAATRGNARRRHLSPRSGLER